MAGLLFVLGMDDVIMMTKSVLHKAFIGLLQGIAWTLTAKMKNWEGVEVYWSRMFWFFEGKLKEIFKGENDDKGSWRQFDKSWLLFKEFCKQNHVHDLEKWEKVQWVIC